MEIEHTFAFPEIMLHTGEKTKRRHRQHRQRQHSKSTLTPSLKHLIQNCYLVVGNSLLRQIGVPMGIDPAPFWANLFLYTYENEYTSELISNDQVKARHFHATKRFIDDIRTLNDGGVFSVYKDIYPPELQLKVDTLVHMQLSLTWISQ